MKRKWLLLFLCLCLVPLLAQADGVPDHQRAELKLTDVKQDNKSIVRTWKITTALPEVDDELNGLVQDYAQRLGPELPKAANNTSKNSRLDSEIRYSWTGQSWMSFLVTARTTYHRELTSHELTSRTYDMLTGEQIYLTDIFDEDSEAWNYLAEQIESQITAYWPEETPDQEQLDAWLDPDAVKEAEFTLHAMSMVLHYPAELVYPEHHTLLEVTIMYPEIWDMMTDEGQLQTDNSHFKFVALTYDDGPSRTPTSQLLNKLRQHGARATFFVIGNRIEKYVDLVRREHDEGHAIGAHNFTHVNISNRSYSNIRAHRTKFDKALLEAIGIPSRYDRVPYGLYPRMVKAEVGWPYIQWSLDTYDWRGRSPNAILSTVKKQVSDGDIILFHDIKEKTQDTADKVITYLKNQGYIFATIDELFARDGVELEGDKVYYRCIDGDTSRK
ncbi:MAG: polysaccharide deacetylase family protein [Clostridia bacterium]|nr:polysaccharide deacetylase family protein [Clostridia bacterium]